MPMWMFLAGFLAAGMSSSRPRGAPEPTKIASKFSSSSAFMLSMRVPPLNSMPRLRM